jgi:hypothetical protein
VERRLCGEARDVFLLRDVFSLCGEARDVFLLRDVFSLCVLPVLPGSFASFTKRLCP